MSKIGQYFMDLPYEETPLPEDPAQAEWLDKYVEETLKTLDEEYEDKDGYF